MSGHRPATVRRAGRKLGARFESAEALAEQPAVARSAVIPRSSSAMPCDDTETVEHAYARRTLLHDPSLSATSTPRRLHTHAPSRSASTYGGRRHRTRLFRDQLWLADAGSWQIADRYTMAS
eukprot:scaffold57659_cov42-Phaeocystis_antarctica.AAC.1